MQGCQPNSPGPPRGLPHMGEGSWARGGTKGDGGAGAPRGAGPNFPSLGAGGQVRGAPNLGFALTPLLLLPRRPVRPPAPGPPGTRWREHPEPAEPCASPEPTAPSPLAQPHSHQLLAVEEMPPPP